MAPTPFNWSRLIAEMTDESFGIPPDVTFQIEENGQLHEVKAHKMILGMVSPIFKTMFYGSDVGDKTTNVIKIEKTTAPAFRIMMDAVYNVKSIEDSLNGKSVHEIFDVVILVDRYQIVELMEAAKELLASYPIADDTVMEVAEDAMEYSNMFEDEVQQLLLTCAKFLKSKLKDLKSVTRYAKENEDKKEVFATMMAMMDDITCSNCNCNKEMCQHGATVKDDEFRVGLLVTNNRAGIWGILDYGTGQVTEVKTDTIAVVSITPGVTRVTSGRNGIRGTQYDGRYDYPKTVVGNVPFFLFACK